MLQLVATALVCAAAVEQAQADEPPAEVPAVQVRFRNEALFEIRAPAGKLSPLERGGAIEARLRAIAAHGGRADLERIHQVEREQSTDVYVGDSFLLSVVDADSLPLGRTRQQLAADDEVALRRALDREYRDRSLNGVLKAVLLALLASAVLVGVLRGLFVLWPPLQERLQGVARGATRLSRLDRLEIFTGARLEALAARVGGTIRLLLVAAVVLIYAGAVLSLFPWTRGYAVAAARKVLGVIGEVAGAVAGYLPNLIYVAAIVFVTRAVLKLAHLFSREVGRGAIAVPGFHPEWAEPTYKIARFLVLALAAVVVFPYLPGAHSPAFQGVSIFVGVLFSLGSSSAIGNIVAGVALTYMRPFSIGDRVKIADTMGDVIERSLLVVRIRTIKNVDVTISNSMVLGNHIVNYSACAREQGLILNSSVTIGYDAPWRQVHELLVTAARSVEGVLAEPAPFVLQTSLDDFYVSYEINCYTNRPNEMAAHYSRLHQAIQDRFNEAGVEIMSPHYAAVRDGNAAALPEESLPKGYEAPAFRIGRRKRS